MEASVQLVEGLGGEVASLAVAIELDFLKGRARFPNHEVFSLLHYNE
jgi:adenine phosphoribosyltransferase